MIIETELPIEIDTLQPNKGDRIIEDANLGNYRLDCLVREGKFLKSVPVKGLSNQVCWVVKLDSGKQGFFDPSICKIIERAAAPVLVEKSKSEFPLEPVFKVGDRVYQQNPDNTGVITKIFRGKAVVNVGSDRHSVRVPLGRLHHCDPNYSPKPKKSTEEIQAEEEEAIARAREEYLKSQSLPVAESVLVEDFAISISGEAIVINPSAKPVKLNGSPIKITENRELYDLLSPICDWYCGRNLATFAVNALGHALVHAREGKVNEAVALLTDEVMAEVVKPKQDVKALKAFLANFVPITTEPNKSVAKLRMDESRVSVLVENTTAQIPLEPDSTRTRLKFLKQQAIALESSGASPKGVWLEKSRPSKRNFDQVCWKADKPHEWLGGKKSRYIGEVDSKEHISAISQHEASQQLRKIEREIKSIEKKLSKS